MMILLGNQASTNWAWTHNDHIGERIHGYCAALAKQKDDYMHVFSQRIIDETTVIYFLPFVIGRKKADTDEFRFLQYRKYSNLYTGQSMHKLKS